MATITPPIRQSLMANLLEQSWQWLFEKGNILQEEKSFSEAILYYKLSLEKSTKINGADSLDNVEILKKLSSLIYIQNNFIQSLKYSSLLATLLQKNNQKNCQSYAFAIQSISRSHFCLGNFQESIKNYLTTISLFENLKGKNSLQVAFLSLWIGNNYRQLDQNQKALKAFSKSQQICQAKIEESNFALQLARTVSSKAAVYRSQGLAAKSFQQTLKSMRILESQGRIESTQYCDNLMCLVNLYLDSHQISQASLRLEDLIKLTQKLKGYLSIQYSKALILKGNLNFLIKGYRGAIGFGMKALQIIEKIYGKESIHCNHALDLMSIGYEKEQIYSQAIRCTSRSYSNNFKFLGDSNILTQKSFKRLNQLKELNQQKRY